MRNAHRKGNNANLERFASVTGDPLSRVEVVPTVWHGSFMKRPPMQVRARHSLAAQAFGVVVLCALGALGLHVLLGVRTDAGLFLLTASALVVFGTRLERKLDELRRGALEDPVTRVGTRRHWEDSFRTEVERAIESRMPLSLLIVDVDHLKALNDAQGHACGDRALSVVGNVLRTTCRSRDVAARFGGDEFAVLLPRTRASEALVVAERMRAEIAKHRTLGNLPVTVSIGVADLGHAVPTPSRETLFAAADAALYRAKQGGRDRVKVAFKQCTSGVIFLDERRPRRRADQHQTSA